jgi:large subunit ribosomal protein L25
MNEAIHVNDLVFENFTVEDDPDDSICSVVPPKIVEEPTEDEEIEGAELEGEEEEMTEPEVITSKKSDSEEEEK